MRLDSLGDDRSAAGPEAPSGGSIALVDSPGQHGQMQQHSSEAALGAAVAVGAAALASL